MSGAPVASAAPAAAPVVPVASPPAVAPAPAPAPAAQPSSPAPVASPAASPAAPAAEGPPAASAEPPIAHEFVPSVMEQGRTDQPAPADPAKPVEPPVKPEDAKPEAAAPPVEEPGPAEAAPVVYEFTFPEDFDPAGLNQERFDAFKATLGENKVTKEAAQKFLDMHAQEVREVANRVREDQWNVFVRQQTRNQEILRKDPEIGGTPERFDASMATCGAAMEHVFPDPQERQGFWDELKTTGAGNMPFTVKFVKRVGELFATEGTPVVAPPPKGQSQAQRQKGVGRYEKSNTPGWNSPA